MRVGTVIAGGVLVYGIRKLAKVRPGNVADVIAKAKDTKTRFVEDVHSCVANNAERESAKAKARAQMLYDNTLATIFEQGTEEERQHLLALFRKYAHSDQ
jgi:hypothetical protein